MKPARITRWSAIPLEGIMYRHASDHQPHGRNIAHFMGLFLCLLVVGCTGSPAQAPTSIPARAATIVADADSGGAATPIPATPTGEPTAVQTAAPTPAAVPTATDQPTQSPPPTALPQVVVDYNTALILDASGSMMANLGGRSRLIVAQDAVGSLSAAMPASINASLWVYGHRVEQADRLC